MCVIRTLNRSNLLGKFYEVIDISLAILIPACASSSPAFHMLYSAYRASLVAQVVKNLPAMQNSSIWFLGHKYPLEKG